MNTTIYFSMLENLLTLWLNLKTKISIKNYIILFSILIVPSASQQDISVYFVKI